MDQKLIFLDWDERNTIPPKANVLLSLGDGQIKDIILPFTLTFL